MLIKEIFSLIKVTTDPKTLKMVKLKLMIVLTNLRMETILAIPHLKKTKYLTKKN
jgi:hypothetical protein